MARSDPDPLPDRPGDGGEPPPGAGFEHADIPAGHPLRWLHVRKFPLFSDPRFLPLPAPRGWNPRSGTEVFAGAKSSRELLHRLWNGDPFDLVGWCMHRVESEHVLVDVSELYLTTVARAAKEGMHYEASRSLEDWLDEVVRRALRDLLERDVREEAANEPLRESDEPRCAFLAELLGIEPSLGRLACICLNALPAEERRVFWAVKVHGRTLRRHVAEGHGPPELARARLHRAMETLIRVGRPPGAEGSEDPS